MKLYDIDQYNVHKVKSKNGTFIHILRDDELIVGFPVSEKMKDIDVMGEVTFKIRKLQTEKQTL